MASKLADLDAALRSAIRPGMTLHLTTHCRAATRAVQRLFRGQPLDLTLVMGRVGGGHGADLVASGLVRRVIAGSYGAATSAHTGPLKQIQRAHASGTVSFQHWSFYSLTQRLMAAAQGFPWVPTYSLIGSDMARDNAAEFRVIDDPLGSGREVGLLAALQPELSVVHALAADAEGNTLVVPTVEDSVAGALASREGAIVTVERVVSRDFIRRHADLMRIPARYVRAVCEVPYGAHPGAFYSPQFPELTGYAEDQAFNTEYFAAMRDPAALAAWVERWIHAPGSHQEYLERLGRHRLVGLHALERASRARPAGVPGSAAAEPGLTATEALMVLATREVMRSVRAARHEVVLVGAGLSECPGSAARELLRREGIEIRLAMGNGFYDLEPYAGYSEPELAQTLMTTDSAEIYGCILGGRPGQALALLGAAQVDVRGNLNSTLAGGKLLTGSGGSNDAASVASTIVVGRLGRHKLVECVEYITCPGARVQALITERGVFRKPPGTDELILCAVFAPAGEVRQAVEEIAAGCAWPVRVAPELESCPVPTALEIDTIRRMLPPRYD